jgi:hypothetical protein
MSVTVAQRRFVAARRCCPRLAPRWPGAAARAHAAHRHSLEYCRRWPGRGSQAEGNLTIQAASLFTRTAGESRGDFSVHVSRVAESYGMGQQNQRNLRGFGFASGHLGQFCLRYVAPSLENIEQFWAILEPILPKPFLRVENGVVRRWILIGDLQTSREWRPEHWRNCPNRTKHKPSYTSMTSNVMETLHSYNGAGRYFCQ